MKVGPINRILLSLHVVDPILLRLQILLFFLINLLVLGHGPKCELLRLGHVTVEELLSVAIW